MSAEVDSTYDIFLSEGFPPSGELQLLEIGELNPALRVPRWEGKGVHEFMSSQRFLLLSE